MAGYVRITKGPKMQIDYIVETKISRSIRARQMETAFDVPAQEKCALHWKGELPIEDFDWNIGMIAGPSGCGKSSILTHVFGMPVPLEWDGASVIDDFADTIDIETITQACLAVGFNTIPAWLRPYKVLSNGEKFRSEIARRMLETPVDKTIVVDEFTSVVDRQVAQIASHAVQKFMRREKRKMVVASCHYDIVDWLQPDWILEPATMTFTRRSLRPRPKINITICRVYHKAWELFAPYHYLTNALHPGAACYMLCVEGNPAAFVGMLHRPHPKAKDITGVSRVVTLPDYQGMGFAFVLMDTLGSAIRGIGNRLHTYPAHPALIRGFDKSPMWSLVRKPGQYSTPTSGKTTLRIKRGEGGGVGAVGDRLVPVGLFGGRACAVFNYEGPRMPRDEAQRLLGVTDAGGAHI